MPSTTATAPRPTRSRRPLGMSLATAMIVTLAPVAGFTLAPAGATTSTPSASWGDCPADVKVTDSAGVAAKCTTITVPMDYANPAAGTFKILATGFFPAGTPKGVIFGNPGGPGGSALDFWGANPYASPPAEMYRDYALIGLQPRGLEHAVSAVCSTLSECTAKADEAYRTSLTTENTARDMDELRKAMGLDKISYLGVSWGTELGATYATLFPSRVDKMVLDSNINPKTVAVGQRQFAAAESTLASERRLYDFFDWAAANNQVIGLGDTPYKVYSAWNAARLAENPMSWIDNYLPPALREADLPEVLRPHAARILPDLNTVVQGMSKLDYAERLNSAAKSYEIYGVNTAAVSQQDGAIITNAGSMMYSSLGWSAYAAQIDMTLRPLDMKRLQELVAAGKISADELGIFALGFGAVSTKIGANGGLSAYQGLAVTDATLKSAFDPAAAQNPDPKLIELRDTAEKAYQDAIAAGESSASIRSKFQVYNGYDYMVRGYVKPLQFSGAGLATAPLLLQSLFDPATVASGARVLAEQLGGKLITVNGGDHGVFPGGSTVLNQAVLQYLGTGKVDITSAPAAPIVARNYAGRFRQLLAENQVGPLAPATVPAIPDTPLNRILSLMGPNVDANSIVPKPTFAKPSTPAPSQTSTATKEPAPALAASTTLTGGLPTAASTPDTTTAPAAVAAPATAPATSTPKSDRPIAAATETGSPTTGTASTGTPTTSKTDTAPSTTDSTPATAGTGAPSTTDKTTTTDSAATEKTTEKSATASEPTEKANTADAGSISSK
ncbi:alpha/beta fold hydrolase [Tsukamurella strandjordii]|uniref:Alpha/beta fold hydrolase n=1 Tax=Tsukamurella strandjordii TaxID=147577 RepID=A0AA90NGK9_9ACTN|nr:alpha/beta fold hydrolase [Tsukamurella strandjordii]MDP0398084.1 alpha/beta fold hydrolase [Tsukamurella strandjordii]